MPVARKWDAVTRDAMYGGEYSCRPPVRSSTRLKRVQFQGPPPPCHEHAGASGQELREGGARDELDGLKGHWVLDGHLLADMGRDPKYTRRVGLEIQRIPRLYPLDVLEAFAKETRVLPSS